MRKAVRLKVRRTWAFLRTFVRVNIFTMSNICIYAYKSVLQLWNAEKKYNRSNCSIHYNTQYRA